MRSLWAMQALNEVCFGYEVFENVGEGLKLKWVYALNGEWGIGPSNMASYKSKLKPIMAHMTSTNRQEHSTTHHHGFMFKK